MQEIADATSVEKKRFSEKAMLLEKIFCSIAFFLLTIRNGVVYSLLFRSVSNTMQASPRRQRGFLF